MVYDNPSGLIAMSIIFEMLAAGSVTLRFISRRRMRAGLQADDWLILAALMPGTGLCIVEIYGVAVEAFGYRWNGFASRPKMDRYYSGLLLQFAFLLLNTVGITLIKLSVIFLYRRIFTKNGSFGYVSLVWIVVLVSWGISFTLWLIFECGSHVSAVYGTFDEYKKYCSQSNSAGYALVYTDLLTDLGTLLMPLPMVSKLRTSPRRKVAIAAVFAIGIFTVAASATRAAIYTHSQEYTGEDILVMMTSLSVWTYLEVMVGICAACAITIRPIFADLSLSAYNLGAFSSIFSRRNSISKASSDASSTTFSASEKHEKLGAGNRSHDDLEAQGYNERVQDESESGHITVKHTYSVSVMGHENEAHNAGGNPFTPPC